MYTMRWFNNLFSKYIIFNQIDFTDFANSLNCNLETLRSIYEFGQQPTVGDVLFILNACKIKPIHLARFLEFSRNSGLYHRQSSINKQIKKSPEELLKELTTALNIVHLFVKDVYTAYLANLIADQKLRGMHEDFITTIYGKKGILEAKYLVYQNIATYEDKHFFVSRNVRLLLPTYGLISKHEELLIQSVLEEDTIPELTTPTPSNLEMMPPLPKHVSILLKSYSDIQLPKVSVAIARSHHTMEKVLGDFFEGEYPILDEHKN